MYTLVFTGPSRKTARFHVTKHVADAQRPRNNRFARCTGCVHTLKPDGNPSITAGTSKNSKPYGLLFLLR